MKKNLVSINDFTKDEILHVLEMAKKFEENPDRSILNGKLIAVLFYEPSTRTRLSFESAIQRLGGRIVGFSEATNTSIRKGESLGDTIRTINQYTDMIIMRNPYDGSARYA
ncbi:MAG: aspartate carbamoyltransferase, partial [Bacteroidales bacterium]